MPRLVNPEIRACRAHLCYRKGQAVFTGDTEKPKCGACGAKLKPMRNLAKYTGPVMNHDPLEHLYSYDGEDETMEIQTNPTPPAGHIITWKAETGKWYCSCSAVLDLYDDKCKHELEVGLVTRRHYTQFESKGGPNGTNIWKCWCGFTADNAKEGNAHDTPYRVPGYLENEHTGCHIKPTTTNDTFTVDPDIKGCPIVKAQNIYIPCSLYTSWRWLAMRFDTEWLAYLKGEYVDKGENIGWHVKSMYFPPQTCTGAHVDVLPTYRTEPGTIGDVHSHVGMKAFFSAEDERHFNHDCHIVINRDGDIETMLRQKLGCGSFTRHKGNIFYMSDEALTAYEADLRTKLTDERTAITTYRSGYRGRSN